MESVKEEIKWDYINVCGQHGVITVGGKPVDHTVDMIPVEVRQMYNDKWYIGLMYVPIIKKFAIMGISVDRENDWSNWWVVKSLHQVCSMRYGVLHDGPFIRPIIAWGSSRLNEKPTIEIPPHAQLIQRFYRHDPEWEN